MDSSDYRKVLDAMPEIGVYVIREDDHKVLYFNKRMRNALSEIAEGKVCSEIWKGSCANCPLLLIGERKTARSVSYNPFFGGEVDTAVARILWEDNIPAFAITVMPRHLYLEEERTADAQRDMQIAAVLKACYSLMNIVDIKSGNCERFRLNGAAGMEKTLVGDYYYFVQQALDRFVHPEDAENYRRMLSLEHLRETAATVDDYLVETCQYRTREASTRWIEQQIIYSRQEDTVTVNILGQDITKRKLKEEEQLQVLQDRAYIISSLSSLYFSTYYVNLESDTYRAVTQLGRVGDVLGGEVNCTAALRIYAENFIHPEDREKYLEIMSIENWQKNLRWWHPYMAMEYRKLPEGEEKDCEWVRATAVMARIGTDDLPKTVLYVAQDITETRKM
ncbi:MAG: hypothetical protein NC400_10505 [Clostridium sp.]|nr:hypothetical protein [Clostridium sp.]